MARNMSFTFTTEQIKNRTKTVTRRLGWDFLQVGDVLNACEKCQGLKKGEKIKKLAQIRVIGEYWEFLGNMPEEDCAKEGFPNLSPQEFVEMFCKHNKCKSTTLIHRIEFEYL